MSARGGCLRWCIPIYRPRGLSSSFCQIDNISPLLEAGSINEETKASKDEAAMEEEVSTCQGLTGPLCPRVPKDGIPAKVSSQRWAPGI